LPAYVAVRAFSPAAANVMEQLPTVASAVQLCVPSETVTSPVGVPLPGATTATLYWIRTAWPTSDGSGRSNVMLVVVSAFIGTTVGVEVGVGVLLGPTVGVLVAVDVRVGVLLGSIVGVLVAVDVGVGVLLGPKVGVLVSVGVGVGVLLGPLVGVLVSVNVGVGVLLGPLVGVLVGVDVRVGVDVTVGVGTVEQEPEPLLKVFDHTGAVVPVW
jgi:hypothetical protein